MLAPQQVRGDNRNKLAPHSVRVGQARKEGEKLFIEKDCVMIKLPQSWLIVICAVFVSTVSVFNIFSTNVFAGNLSFLNNSAITKFTDEDRDLMMANIMYALDHIKDGRKSAWKNPHSGAWGYAIPSRSATVKGKICRNITTFNFAKGVTGESIYRLCKCGKQRWQIISFRRLPVQEDIHPPYVVGLNEDEAGAKKGDGAP